jgi:hypothetical protein
MTRIAVLDDWQEVAKSSAAWSRLMERAEVRFFREPFAGEDAAAQALEARGVRIDDEAPEMLEDA